MDEILDTRIVYDLNNEFMFYCGDEPPCSGAWSEPRLKLTVKGDKKLRKFLCILRDACENNPEFCEEIEKYWESANNVDVKGEAEYFAHEAMKVQKFPFK